MKRSVEEVWGIVSDDVDDFSWEMLMKLWHHKKKGYWMDVPEEGPDYYLHRLKQEVQELTIALESETPEDVVKECADIANFAMMIAMKVKDLDNSEVEVV
jgi:phosphoribosyl-ATP pyrophosphohydrolase